MKTINKVAILLLAIIFAAGSASAQFRFGVKVGANFNKLHLDNLSDNFKSDNGAGFTGGIMGEFTIPVVGICFDASLMYTRMNSRIDSNLSNLPEQTGMQTETSSKSRNFFQIPINIKYKFSLPIVGNVIAPYIFTGPDFAFKLGGKDDVFSTKTFQSAWNVGVGVELIHHLQVQGSYGFGMNNIMKNFSGDYNLSNDIKVRNNYWTVTAAWLF